MRIAFLQPGVEWLVVQNLLMTRQVFQIIIFDPRADSQIG